MNRRVIHHHLGLGDHFVCNGLVNYVLDDCDLVYIPAKRRNYNTVRCLYSDEDRVQVFIVDDEARDVDAFGVMANCEIVRVGFEHCDRDCFDVSFYRQLKIPFESRYIRFRLPQTIPDETKVYDLFAKHEDYCLVHRECSGGIYHLKIDTELPLVYIEKGTDPYNNLLNYRRLIQQAREIHCINSSVFHLVDSISPQAKLFYHDVRKRNFSIRRCWKIVEYASNPVSRAVRGALARARHIDEEAWGLFTRRGT
jgi:hypothetical protein